VTLPEEELPRRRFGRRKRRRIPRFERRRAIFLLPNLITTGALLLGFFSLTLTLDGNYSAAAFAILAAAVLDMMDGGIARATRSTSRFGVEYDSLSDLVSFGVAPAFLLHASRLAPLGNRAWALSALFAVCAALRLARFNVQKDLALVHGYGLASTIAGCIVAVTVWFLEDTGTGGPGVRAALAIGFVVLSLLMVSSVPYVTWKSLTQGRRQVFPLLLGLVVIGTLALVAGSTGVFAVSLLYVVSGPALWLWLRWNGTPVHPPQPTPELSQAEP